MKPQNSTTVFLKALATLAASFAFAVLTAGSAMGAADTSLTGDGHDGAYTAPAGTTQLNSYAPVASAVSAGASSLTRGTVSTGAVTFANSRLVLVIQSSGYTGTAASGDQTAIDLTNSGTGRWEFARISTTAGTTVNFTAPLIYSYTVTGAQIVAIPEYTTVAIAAGRTLSAAAWDGTRGGIVGFLATGAITNDGTVTSAGMGFRAGGNNSASGSGCTALDSAANLGNGGKGEGLVPGSYGSTNNARGNITTGAGGGDCENAGGGGGGNGGQGGIGGNSYDGSRVVGGLGGAKLTYSPFDHFLFGGGGGGGGTNNAAVTPGGVGGGVTMIRGASLSGTGTISAAGASAPDTALNDGAGGGGAGGVVYLRFTGTLACSLATVQGGNGGNETYGSHGPGAGGAGGKMLIQTTANSCTTNVSNGVSGASGPSGSGGPRGAGPTGSGDVTSNGSGATYVQSLAAPTAAIAAPTNGSTVNSATPIISGTATAGATVSVYIDGVLSGTATADIAGLWSHTPGSSLSNASHTVYAIPLHQGITGTQTATNTFTVDTVAPNTSISTSPTTPGNDNTPTWNFTSTEVGSTFQCKVEAGASAGAAAFGACSGSGTHTPSALADGTYTFSVRATDVAGNTDATPATSTIVVDTTAPNTTISTTPTTPSSDTTPTWNFTSTEAGSTFQCKVEAGASAGAAAFGACSGLGTHTPAALAAGTYTFSVRATDPSGNTDASPATSTIVIDTIAPNTTISTTPTTPGNDNTPTWNFTSSEAGSTFQCKVEVGASAGAAAFAACSGSGTHTPTALADGTYTFSVRATDPSGNTDATPATSTIVIDTSAPNTTISTTPTTPGNDNTPTWNFTSTEVGSTFQCKVEAGASAGAAAFGACSGSGTHTPSALADGTYTFSVRSIDPSGNTDGSPATSTIVVDTSAPNTTISTSPTTPGTDTTPTWNFTSTEVGSTFQCKVEAGASAGAGAFSACSGSGTHTQSALADGTYTFSVRATDPSGNTDASPATSTIVIDTTAPNTTISTSPTTPGNDNTPTWNFTSTEVGSTFQCKVEAGASAGAAAFGACSGSGTHTPSALADGTYTFSVRAIDPSGNTDASPSTSTIVIDTVAPNTTISTTPTTPGNDNTPTWNFTSTEGGSTFQCKVEAGASAGAGAFSACSGLGTHTPSALADGTYTFSVRATDPSGNPDATPITSTIVIDTVAPNTTISSSPATPGIDTTPTWNFTSTEAGSTFQCKVEAGASAGAAAFAACSGAGTHTSSVLADGTYTFSVRATDSSGNTDPTPVTSTIVIDTVAPNTTISTSPTTPGGDSTPTWSFTSTEAGSTFQCKVEAGASAGAAAFGACSGSGTHTSTALADGTYTFSVRAIDPSGNTDASPSTSTIVIDTVAPAVPVVAAPSAGATLADDTPTFTGTAEANSLVTVYLNGVVIGTANADGAGAWSFTPASSIGDGNHAVRATATDAAGNTSAQSTAVNFSVDTGPPNTSITSQPANSSNDNTPSFGFDSTDLGSTFECSIDGGAYAACTSIATFGPLADGNHTIAIRATDSASNVDPTPATYSWTINTAVPPTNPVPTPDPTPPADPTNNLPECPPGAAGEDAAKISVLKATRNQKIRLKFDVSSDKYAIARLTVKQNGKSVGMSARVINRGKRAIFVRMKKLPAKNAEFQVLLDAITESGGRSLAASRVVIDGAGKITVAPITGTLGTTVTSVTCGASRTAKPIKFVMTPTALQVSAKGMTITAKANQWAVTTFTVVQNGKLLSRKVRVLPPNKAQKQAMPLLAGAKLAAGGYTVNASTYSLDGLKLVSSKQFTAK